MISYNPLSDDEKKTIKNLYINENLPVTVIAKKLNRSSGTISRYLNNQNFYKEMKKQALGIDFEYIPLSSKEQEVYQLLIDGLKPINIAEKLCLSITTIKTHINNIYSKTGCNSQAALCAKEIRKLREKLENANI